MRTGQHQKAAYLPDQLFHMCVSAQIVLGTESILKVEPNLV